MFLEAGFKVTCVDADQSIVRNLLKGKAGFLNRELETKLRVYVNSGVLTVTSELRSSILQSNIVILSIPVKIDGKESSSSSEIGNRLKQIGTIMNQGTLVLYASVAELGFMENVVKEKLENSSGFKMGENLGLAYLQKLTNGNETTIGAINGEFMIAANDQVSLNAAALILSTIIKKVKLVNNFRLAELATLFTLVIKDVAKALTNELALLCENAKVDYLEVLKLLNLELQETDYIPGINGQENKLGTSLLLESTENLGVKLRLLESVRHVNDDMIKHVVNLTQNTLRTCGKTLRRSRIAVLSSTEIGTAGEMLVKMLEMKGARINIYDAHVRKSEKPNVTYIPKRNITEAIENSDCIVVLTREEQFKNLNLKNLRSVMKTPAAIVDVAGIFEPQKVETEGFIYRRLGRGLEEV
jgi:nucleotide sugar dehydrogenase